MMSQDISHPSKAIEFFLENKGSKLSLQNLDSFIKNIEGVKSAEVDQASGQAKITLKDDTLFDKKLIEIQRILFKEGYEVTAKNTNGVQAYLFFGTMVLGFLFVAVVISLFYYFGSLPSLI